MISQILTMFESVYFAVVEWFSELMNAVSGMEYLLAVLAAMLVIRFIVMPIMGGKGSDRAKKGKAAEE